MQSSTIKLFTIGKFACHDTPTDIIFIASDTHLVHFKLTVLHLFRRVEHTAFVLNFVLVFVPSLNNSRLTVNVLLYQRRRTQCFCLDQQTSTTKCMKTAELHVRLLRTKPYLNHNC